MIVTGAPAIGLKLDDVTRYFVAAPGIDTIEAVVPVRLPPSVPVTVVEVAETV